MMEPLPITSAQNSRLKQALKLRDRRGRKVQGRTILDGRRETEMALRFHWPLRELFCRESALLHEEPVQRLAEEASRQGVEVLCVSDPLFQKLAFGDRDEGLVATTDLPELTLDKLTLPESPLICIADQVEKPGNLGAILRTAEAAGVDGVILADPQTDPFNPNAIRASLGAVFHLPLAVATAEEVMGWLRSQSIRILATRVDGSKPYDEACYDGAVAIVLGSEAKGLGKVWEGANVTAVAIPMRGEIDSLNVSAAAAVLLFEAVRQRRGHA